MSLSCGMWQAARIRQGPVTEMLVFCMKNSVSVAERTNSVPYIPFTHGTYASNETRGMDENPSASPFPTDPTNGTSVFHIPFFPPPSFANVFKKPRQDFA